MPRIQIVGAPRSGTTLMHELMINGFEIDGYSKTEESLLDAQAPGARIYCGKDPWDTALVRWLLPLDPELWVIYLLRDPRDVIVSRHALKPELYWANLRLWRWAHSSVRGLERHPRFVCLRYEDLVKAPDEIQRRLAKAMPFLRVKHAFSQYHETSEPSQQSLQAMRGVRRVEASSIGVWREHKTRVAAQIRRHGDITDELITLGYETERDWLGEIDQEGAAATESFWPEDWPERRHWRKRLKRGVRTAWGLARFAARGLGHRIGLGKPARGSVSLRSGKSGGSDGT